MSMVRYILFLGVFAFWGGNGELVDKSVTQPELKCFV